MTKPIRAAIYQRVSTEDQHTANQQQALEQVLAQRGWTLVQVYEDAGISGAKGRDKRPGLDNMLKDATRGKFDIVMAWSVDRLGRSLEDLLGMLKELEGARVDLFLHQQALDTTTPAGRALFGMLGVFAEFERSMICARVNAGVARAQAKGTHCGRPQSKPRPPVDVIRAELASGLSIRAVAAKLGTSKTAVEEARAGWSALAAAA